MATRIVRGSQAKRRAVAREELTKRTTHAQFKDSKGQLPEEEQVETLEMTKFPPGVEPAFVRVNLGQTVNLGNYESFRVDVSVTVPCLPESKAIDKAYRYASASVAEKVEEELQNWNIR